MMNMLEEAIVYATIMHQGKVRKFGGRPFILHPMEVAQILSTMTDDYFMAVCEHYFPGADKLFPRRDHF